jgi:hypothetical protein
VEQISRSNLVDFQVFDWLEGEEVKYSGGRYFSWGDGHLLMTCSLT